MSAALIEADSWLASKCGGSNSPAPTCQSRADDGVCHREGGCGCDTGELTSPILFHASRSHDACAHDFKGWREFADGRGGMGAMEYTLKRGDF